MSAHSPPEYRFNVRNRIQFRLILLLCTLLLPTLLIQFYIYYDRFHTRRMEELSANLEIARAVGKAFDAFVMDIVHTELAIGLSIVTLRQDSDEIQNQILEKFRADNLPIHVAIWIAPNGVVLAASHAVAIGRNVSDRSYYKRIAAGHPWALGELVVGMVTGNSTFIIGRGIRNNQGQLLGIVAAAVSPDHLDSVLGIERTKGAGISIVDSKGMLVYRYPHIALSWEARNWLKVLPELQRTLDGNEYAWIGKSVYEDTVRITASVPIPSIGWIAEAGRSEGDALSAIRASLLPQTALFLLVTITAFSAALAFSHKISASIKKLRGHAAFLGMGGRQEPVHMSGIAELDDLAGAFNEMMKGIQEREKAITEVEQALRESDERFHAFMNNIPCTAWMKDQLGQYIYLNAPGQADFGKLLEDCLGKTDFDLFPTERAQKFRRDDLSVLGNDRPEWFCDEYDSVDGHHRIFWKLKFPMEDGTGKRYIGGIGLDITERRQMEEELQRSEGAYRLLFETMPVGVAYRNAEGSIIKVNSAAENIIGRSRQEILGRKSASMEDLSLREDGSPWPDSEHPSRVALLTGQEVDGAVMGVFNPRENAYRWINVKAVPLLHEGELRPYEVYTVFNDITEQKKLEQDLRNSHRDLERRVQERTEELAASIQRLKLATEVAGMGIWELDVDGRKIVWDARLFDILGVNGGKSITYENWSEIIHPDDVPGILDRFWNDIYREGRCEFECRIIRPSDKAVRQIQCTSMAIVNDDSVVDKVVGIYFDITERKRLEAELRGIPAKLIAVQEEERRRLASELHDTIGQTLAAVKFWVEMVLKYRDEGQFFSALDQLEKFVPVLQRSIDETRSIYMGLRPSLLDNVGLLATLEWLRQENMRLFPQRHIEFESGVSETEIPQILKIPIFRIVQEALNNVSKHSKADWVDIVLLSRGDAIELVVSDDGVGMELEQVLQNSISRSLGLTSMRERAELTGGRFVIESIPGEGTTIRVNWPHICDAVRQVVQNTARG